MEDYDYKILKEKYGEKFARLCRKLFPTLLEEEGVLSEIITKKFAESKFLYDDIVKFEREEHLKDLVYSLVESKTENLKKTGENPYDLMKKAGYTLVKCKKPKHIKAFKKYYEPSELICTFDESRERLKTHYVYFAVKDNAHELDRKSFRNPQRQDEYGTSVISLQFNKRDGMQFITNRYNHSVRRPDATFANDLENIIPGLTISFEEELSIRVVRSESRFAMLNYVKGNDDKLYKYNCFISPHCYIGIDNNVILVNGEVLSYNKDKDIAFEGFVLDLKEKEMRTAFDHEDNKENSFLEGFDDMSKIEVKKHKAGKLITITTSKDEKILLELDIKNNLIKYYNEKTTQIGDDFLSYAKSLEEISLPNAEKIGYNFLARSERLKTVNLPNAKVIGENFLFNSFNLKKISLPKAEEIDNNFLYENKDLEEIYLPNVKKIRDYFLNRNQLLKVINLPKAETVGMRFIQNNKNLQEIYVDSLTNADDWFLYNNNGVLKVSLPSLKKVGRQFLSCNEVIEELYLPELVEAGSNFLYGNKSIKTIHAPKLVKISSPFLASHPRGEDISEAITMRKKSSSGSRK